MPADEVKKEANRRMKDPLIGSYILSWLAFNYDIIFTALSLEHPAVKIYYVKTCFEDHYLTVFIIPLLSALFITYFLPWALTYPAIWKLQIDQCREKKLIQQQNRKALFDEDAQVLRESARAIKEHLRLETICCKKRTNRLDQLSSTLIIYEDSFYPNDPNLSPTDPAIRAADEAKQEHYEKMNIEKALKSI